LFVDGVESRPSRDRKEKSFSSDFIVLSSRRKFSHQLVSFVLDLIDFVKTRSLCWVRGEIAKLKSIKLKHKTPKRRDERFFFLILAFTHTHFT
jgi:hypothetical protein